MLRCLSEKAMSVHRALLGASKYQRCCYSSYEACTRPVRIPLHSLRTILSRSLLESTKRDIVSANPSSIKRFGTCSVSRAQHSDDNAEDSQPKATATPEPTSVDDSTPWYLRVQDEEAPENTLLERQRLPAIPKDCPPQIKDIVNHLSEGIGLEYLTLIDLRELDPPPALGSNLIMIIGTARSTRHLNVSADRFCRWLRSTYDLSPHADGLLGRNELKLKLRRRARRAKILGNKLRPSDGDDGITTGWICVNAGVLNHGNTGDQLLRNEEGSVVGFGQNDSGTNIVVQFLTEEKRESLDLDGLWAKYVDRQRIRLARLGSDADLENRDDRPALSPNKTEDFQTNSSSEAKYMDSRTPRIHSRISTNVEQRRSFQTVPGSLHPFQELQAISQLPPDECLTALGTGWEDKSSTSFLKSFHGSIGTPSAVTYYDARLALIRLALKLRHPGYGASCLLHTLNQACESLVIVPENVFNVVLCELSQHWTSDEVPGTEEYPRGEQILSFLTVLEDMSLRGFNFYTQPIMDGLFDLICNVKKQDPRIAKKYLDPCPLGQIALLADKNECTLSGQSRRIEAIKELIKSHKWNEAWRVWSWFPVQEECRPASLYATVFRSMAETRHQVACIGALTKLVPTMVLETPPIRVEGDTAAAMIECLKVADPGIQARHERGETEHRPWGSLFEACVRGLRDPNASAESVAM